MNALGSVGHNRPDYVADMRATMNDELERFRARRDQFVAGHTKYLTIRDRIDAGKAVDFIGMVNEVSDMVEKARKDVTGPHYDAQRTGIAIAEQFWSEVIEARDAVQVVLDGYNTARAAMQKQQEEEQRQFQAAARPSDGPRDKVDYTSGQAAPDAPQTARAPRKQAIVGDLGYKQVEVQKTEVEIVNMRDLPDSILNSDPVREAAAKIVLGMLKLTKANEMSGCIIRKPGDTSIRR